MTIETLMHIYNLLQADAAKKEFAYQCESSRREHWMDNTSTTWQEAEKTYPEQKEYLEAQREYRRSQNCLEEFLGKQWD